MRIKTIGICAMAMAALSLSACAGGTTPATSAASSTTSAATGGGVEGAYIAIVSKGEQHQFWQAVKAGAEAEAKKQGVTVTFEGPATEKEVEKQLTMLTNALAKNPKAIGFAALDSKAAGDLLGQIKAKNIPVVAFDSGVDSDIPLATAATDSKKAAGEAATQMCKLINGKGTVGVIAHDQTSKTGMDRRDGFLEGMKAGCPGVKLLEVQYGDGDHAKSADIAKSMIAANADLVGIFGTNEGSAIGAVKGVEEAKKTGLTLIGFDSGKAQKDAIKSGLMAGAITQNPVGMGEAVVKAAVAAIKGEKLEKFIDTGYYWYDKTNIDDPKIAAVLYD